MAVLRVNWSSFRFVVSLLLCIPVLPGLWNLGISQGQSRRTNISEGGEPVQNHGFQQPTADERLKAVGDLRNIPLPQRSYFQPTEVNRSVPDPEPGDWLYEHDEIHQSFDLYLRERPNRPDSRRNVIYLLPLDTFDEYAPPIDDLRAFLQAYYGVTTRVLPQHRLPENRITQRVNSTTQHPQMLTTDILRDLEGLLPSDAYCLLAVTMTDLYPDPKWNFVFGQATFKKRVGVYSFSRFDPAFWGEKRTPEERLQMLRRTCQLIAHETGHMFGIRHCVFYECLMNGSNHQAESDSQPLRPCPVCLRKMHWAVPFDPGERQERVAEILKRIGIVEDALTRRD